MGLAYLPTLTFAQLNLILLKFNNSKKPEFLQLNVNENMALFYKKIIGDKFRKLIHAIVIEVYSSRLN